jgi:hypothetical protein
MPLPLLNSFAGPFREKEENDSDSHSGQLLRRAEVWFGVRQHTLASRTMDGHVLAGDAVLVDVLPLDLLCQICHSCATNVKQCRYGHLFCERCILQWLSVKAACPCCNERLTVAELGDNLVAKGETRPFFCPPLDLVKRNDCQAGCPLHQLGQAGGAIGRRWPRFQAPQTGG